jgi:hypothetical protein
MVALAHNGTNVCVRAISIDKTNFETLNINLNFLAMELIGHLYEKPTLMFLKNNMKTAVVKGMKLYTTEKVYDEADLHYFRDNPKSIPENQQVTVIGCWMNFYGSWITCLYDGKNYDVKPSALAEKI